MKLNERIDEIKKELRKKISDEKLHDCVIKLLKIEDEIRRNVKKALKDNKHELHFTSGDLRVIATCINTKMTRFQKQLYFESVDNIFDEAEIIDDTFFTSVIDQQIVKYLRFQKLSDCHYLLGTITPTVRLIEDMKKKCNMD